MTNHPHDPGSSEPAELAARLANLGRTPVDPAVASAHLTAMAAVRSDFGRGPARGRLVRVKYAAVFAAGLVLGGSGLASAGALGTTPQNAVADAASRVGVDLPGGTPRSTEGCGGETYRNHGDFVSRGGDPHAACGKPLKSTDKASKSKDKPGKPTGEPGTEQRGAHGCGKPPWAGKGNQAKKTPAAVAAREATCGGDAADADETDDAEENNGAAKNDNGKKGTGVAPTTTVGATAPTTTTTTTPAPTTTTGATTSTTGPPTTSAATTTTTP